MRKGANTYTHATHIALTKAGNGEKLASVIKNKVTPRAAAPPSRPSLPDEEHKSPRKPDHGNPTSAAAPDSDNPPKKDRDKHTGKASHRPGGASNPSDWSPPKFEHNWRNFSLCMDLMRAGGDCLTISSNNGGKTRPNGNLIRELSPVVSRYYIHTNKNKRKFLVLSYPTIELMRSERLRLQKLFITGNNERIRAQLLYWGSGPWDAGTSHDERLDRLVISGVSASSKDAAVKLVLAQVKEVLMKRPRETYVAWNPDHWVEHDSGACTSGDNTFSVFLTFYGFNIASNIVEELHAYRQQRTGHKVSIWRVFGPNELRLCSNCGKRGHLASECKIGGVIRLDCNRLFSDAFLLDINSCSEVSYAHIGEYQSLVGRHKTWANVHFDSQPTAVSALKEGDFALLIDAMSKAGFLARTPILSSRKLPCCHACGLLASDTPTNASGLEIRGARGHRAGDAHCPLSWSNLPSPNHPHASPCDTLSLPSHRVHWIPHRDPRGYTHGGHWAPLTTSRPETLANKDAGEQQTPTDTTGTVKKDNVTTAANAGGPARDNDATNNSKTTHNPGNTGSPDPGHGQEAGTQAIRPGAEHGRYTTEQPGDAKLNLDSTDILDTGIVQKPDAVCPANDDTPDFSDEGDEASQASQWSEVEDLNMSTSASKTSVPLDDISDTSVPFRTPPGSLGIKEDVRKESPNHDVSETHAMETDVDCPLSTPKTNIGVRLVLPQTWKPRFGHKRSFLVIDDCNRVLSTNNELLGRPPCPTERYLPVCFNRLTGPMTTEGVRKAYSMPVLLHRNNLGPILACGHLDIKGLLPPDLLTQATKTTRTQLTTKAEPIAWYCRTKVPWLLQFIVLLTLAAVYILQSDQSNRTDPTHP
jgi:hypothetical protein